MQRFHEKNDPNSPTIEDFIFFKLPDFYDKKLQQIAKNIERFRVFLLSYLVHNQIWLNYFLANHHFGCVTKSLKEKPTLPSALAPLATLQKWRRTFFKKKTLLPMSFEDTTQCSYSCMKAKRDNKYLQFFSFKFGVQGLGFKP